MGACRVFLNEYHQTVDITGIEKSLTDQAYYVVFQLPDDLRLETGHHEMCVKFICVEIEIIDKIIEWLCS